MHGLSTIRRLNGGLTDEEQEAARRSAAAKPVTQTEEKPGDNPGEIVKPTTV
jgi:hypothetical protein